MSELTIKDMNEILENYAIKRQALIQKPSIEAKRLNVKYLHEARKLIESAITEAYKKGYVDAGIKGLTDE